MKCNFCIQADCRMYRCSEIIYERGEIAKDLHPVLRMCDPNEVVL